MLYPKERRRASPGGRNPGDKRRPLPASKRGNIDAAPASLGGRNAKEQPYGKRGIIDAAPAPLGDETLKNNPLASVASSKPPQLPLGDETLRNKEELPLRDKTLRNKRRASLGGRNPGDNNNDNAQPSRVGLIERTKQNKTKQKRNNQGSWTQQGPWSSIIMVITTKQQRWRATTKVEANEAGFSSGM